MVKDIDAWFAELDRFADVPFMEERPRQPPMPRAEDLLDLNPRDIDALIAFLKPRQGK